MLKVWLCLCMLRLQGHEWLKMHKAMGLISTHLVNLLLCTLKMMKINRQVNSAVSYPNLVSFPSSAFMFDINLWIENNHMKCSSHMAFLCVQNFTLLQKRIEVFYQIHWLKKPTNFFYMTILFRNCQISIYGPSRDQQIYKDIWKISFHILLIAKFD
jgi:uncharacterized protein involved in response to NO